MVRIASVASGLCASAPVLALTVALDVGAPCEPPSHVVASDVAYLPDGGEIALSDPVSAEIHLLDDRCRVTRSFSTAKAGALSPAGVAYHPIERTFAVTDAGAEDRLYLFDEDGSFLRTRTVATLGDAAEVAYDPTGDGYVVVDRAAGDLVRVDADGALLGRLSVDACGVTQPDGVAYDSDAGRYVVGVDEILGKTLHFLGPDGACLDSVPARGTLEGLAHRSGQHRLVIVDDADLVRSLDVRGELADRIDLPAALSAPTAVTVIAGHGQLAMADATGLIGFLSPDGQLLDSCDTAAIGASAPIGLAYLPDSDTLALLDTDERVHVVERATCTALSSFPTAALGVPIPTGLGALNPTGELMLLDQSAKMVLATPEGELVGALSAHLFGSSNGQGAAYLPAGGTLAVANDVGDLRWIDVATTSGLPVASFSVAEPGMLELEDVAIDPSSGEIFALDGERANLYVFTMPALAVPAGVTGVFEGELLGESTSLTLVDLGRGSIAGALQHGGTEVDAPGYATDGGELVLTVVLDGVPTVQVGAFDVEFRTLTFPAPLGTWVRR